jgi:hypothetical protein
LRRLPVDEFSLKCINHFSLNSPLLVGVN